MYKLGITTRKDYQIQIRITGTIRGRIWSGQECEKRFNYLVEDGSHYSDNKRLTLRECLLNITNDGDFQDSEILRDCQIIVTYWTKSGKKITRYFELNFNNEEIQDLILDDYPQFDGEF